MTRRLVLLFDGTGQVLRTGAATNVVHLLEALDPEVEGEEIPIQRGRSNVRGVTCI